MALVYHIQKFLDKKLTASKLNYKSFATKSNIPYTTVLGIMNGIHLNPSMNNILKIADYFNCAIDEILERDQFIQKNSVYSHITPIIMVRNLQEYLNNKNTDLYKLSMCLGFGYNSLYNFVHNNKKYSTLSSVLLVALADHFHTSIDKIIGRTTVQC